MNVPVFAHLYDYEYEDKSGSKTIGKYRIAVYKIPEGGFINIHNANQQLDAGIVVTDKMYNKLISGDKIDICEYTKIANDVWREKNIT